MSLKLNTNDQTATFAEAFFIANLLFIGIFYIALWVLYLRHYKEASEVGKHHLKQTLLAASISTSIAVLMNIGILLTTGYASLAGLFMAEFYLMIVVPVFLIMGIFGFTKASKDEKYTFPVIGRLIKS
ncbi:MAG: DUF4870 domain-containing protein [Cocleimonas sp.]|nr:DUF4870 domain-containing protein [Cocleimonas sp.]